MRYTSFILDEVEPFVAGDLDRLAPCTTTAFRSRLDRPQSSQRRQFGWRPRLGPMSLWLSVSARVRPGRCNVGTIIRCHMKSSNNLPPQEEGAGTFASSANNVRTQYAVHSTNGVVSLTIRSWKA